MSVGSQIFYFLILSVSEIEPAIMPSMATSKKVTGELRKQIEEEEAWNNEYLQQKQRNLANFKKHVEEVEDCKEPRKR